MGSPARAERLRPRRLEPDTLAYLQEASASLSSSSSLDDDAPLLLANVLHELAPRAASAASDRHAAALLERLLPRLTSLQLRFLLFKMEGYFSHLWTNRYSSHVLQHVLARAAAVVAEELQPQNDEKDEEEDERLAGTPAMSELVVNMASEVEHEWLSLLNDVSASHVLRSLLALLAGRALAADKRGKKAKHRVLAFGAASDVLPVPASFEALFARILRAFRAAPTQQMLALMFDANAGPLLAAALRLAPPKPAHKLAQHVLQWRDEQASVQTFFDYAGDAVTSHFLEALFETVSDEFFAAIYRRCLQGKLLEFAEHNIANYVVQNAIQRMRDPELARLVLDELDGALWTLLSKQRAGVVWRLVEMCRRVDTHTQEIFTAVVDAVKKQESKKPEAARKDVVPALLALQLSTGTGANKVHLNVLGAKILAELLAFEYSESMEPLYRGILSFNTAQLLALATDSTGSRCVVEPIWESEDAERAWVRQELFAKFVGKFGELALDRLGAFSVIKCYERLALQDKATVAQELLAVEGKLSGSHFAQLVMNTVHLYEFRNNREKWEALYEKKDKLVDMFKDVVGGEDAVETSAKKTKKPKRSKTSEESDKPSKRKQAPHDTSEDIAAIMGALRGSADAKKAKKKAKKQRRDD